MPPDDAAVVVLMLHKSEEATDDLALWILDNNVKDESEILRKAMGLHNALPPNQQTGRPVEVMSPT